MTRQTLTPAVVLVADRTLSASYKVLFEGIFATMQTTQVPEIAMKKFVAPPIKTDSFGRAVAAPLGLRRVESALLKFTDLNADDVVCTTPEALPKLLGDWTKVVAFSSSDPLGMGMSNTTTKNFWKGDLYSSYWTKKMMTRVAQAKTKHNFKVVAGGGGAWQLAYDRKSAESLGIDVIFEGYFENLGPGLFTDLIDNNQTQNYICENNTAAEYIQPIKGPTVLGAVEFSRGCGRGCGFCTMAAKKMSHITPDIICADIETNAAADVATVVSGSEDFFRYGSPGLKPDFEKLTDLLDKMRSIDGLSFMQIDHANITSVLNLTDEQLKEIRRLLTWGKHTDYLWVNMGVESANGWLVAANCPGKISGFRPCNWQDMVIETAQKMTRNGFFSVFSVILGLPGETPEDVEKTLKLVKMLGKQHAVIFPIFYEPLSTEQIEANQRFTIKKMRLDHLELYKTCYEINFQKVPLLFWDNQRAGGTSLLKRSLMQLLGKCEVRSWRHTFKKVGTQIEQRQVPLEK